MVGVDDSEASRIAVRAACAEAILHHCPLHIVHADPFGEPTHSAAGPLPDVQGYGLVDALTRAREATARIAVTGEVARGFPEPVLIAMSRQAELVVIGHRGLGALARALFDTVGSEVTRRAGCPVLVARAPDLPDGPVVVGVDGSPDSQAAAEFAVVEAGMRGCAVHVMHVWSRPGPHAPGSVLPVDLDAESVQAGAERLLSETMAGWGDAYPDVDIQHSLVHGHPRQVLTEAAASASLLVVGARGRTTPPVPGLGSVSRHLLHHAACSLAVVPRHLPEGS
ncbi:universal stress protein [Catenulispora subtropica]|uniref:Universal stress protein n=1 Tax=Catenulispora subtropica TaxID=450798 RepID=A0ABN2RLX2_9ACTN